MKPITSILVAGLLFIALNLAGQPLVTNFFPAAVTAPVNNTVTLELKVSGFNNIASMQFPIKYNNTLLQFVSVNGFNLPELTSGNFNNLPAQGVVRFTWFPEDQAAFPNGVSVPDGTTIFTISFKVLANGTSTVNIDGVVAPGIEIRRNTGALVTLNYQQGGSTITGGTVTPPPTQIQVFANTIYVPKDSIRCMPVTVNNMTNVLSMQYAMHWNTSVLQYQNTKAYDIPYLNASNFNVPATPPGTLLFAWDDESLQGVTRPNGHKMYEVCFKGIGAVGTNSLITINGTGLPPTGGGAEALNTDSQNIWGASSGVTDTVFVTNAPLPNNSLTFTVDRDTVPVGGATTCVDVRVKNFMDVIALQYGMTYDPTKLTYSSISFANGNPLDLSMGISGPNFVAPPTIAAGTIRLIWDDDSVPFGVTVPDNGSIYAICFAVNPAVPAGTTIPINIGSITGLPAGFAKEGAGEVPAILNAGHVYVSAALPCTVTGVVTNATCAGPNTGAINVSVSASCPTHTYAWAGPAGFPGATTEDISNLGAGSYTVTVSFTGGTTQTATFTVTAPVAVSATSTVTPVNCFGGSDGAINLTPAGGTAPYTFVWTGPAGFPGATTEDISNLASGIYTVVITDAGSCSFTPPSISVTQPNAIAIPSNQVSITNTCFGQTNGAINISVTGGTGPYTFLWAGPNGFTAATEDISNLASGAYTVTVTDTKGCTFVSSPAYTVQAPGSALGVTVQSSQNIACFNNCNGQVTINVTGGTAPFTYRWALVNNPNNTLSISKNPNNLCAGTYNVTVTDAGNCTAILAVPVTITQPSSGLTVSHTQTNVTCPGGNNGCISLTITGGSGTNTVTWVPNIPGGANPCGLSAGTYTPTVTDAGGCSIVYQAITITGPAPITIGTPSINNVSCFGGGDGGIVINPAGGNGGPYTVIWNGSPLSGSAISALTGGLYTPVVTDGLGCSASFNAIIVTEPPTPITLSAVITPQNGAQFGSIDLTVTGGTPSYLFTWSTTPNVFSEDLTNVVAGTYTVTVTDANACTLSGTYTVLQNNVVDGTTVTSVVNSCNNDGCINISVPPAAAGPFQVTWTGGGSQSFPGNTISICNLAPNPYSITVTAANGNSVVLTATVNQLQAAIVNSSFQNPFDEADNGSITLTPTFTGATYQWNYQNLNTSSISGLDSGLYVVTVTNTNSGCTAVYTFPLVRQYQPFNPGLSSANPTCLTSNNGSVSTNATGGDGPTYTYQWAGPNGFTAATQNISGLAGGTYTVTYTDQSGTTYTATATLVVQSNLAITNVNETSIYPGGFQVSAQGVCDGAANVAFTGAFGTPSILWSNNAVTASTNTLCGGAYSVTVTDDLGCSSVWTDALTVPEGVNGNAENSTLISCHGACNGAARVTVSGGVGPYTVKWSTGQTEPVGSAPDYSEAVNLCGGTYTITITDNNGATSIETVQVVDPAAITVVFSDPIVPNTFNSCDGQLFANVTGAIGTVNIVWSGSLGHSGTGPRSEGLCANEVVQYVITDANNCAAVVTDTVPYPNDGCLRVRPVLTPAEQDGNNDYVHITCIETVRHRVEIYNRWGQIVFETEDYQNNDDVTPGSTTTWYGLNKSGQTFAEGVYYYILTYIDVDGNEKQLKGYINLLK